MSPPRINRTVHRTAAAMGISLAIAGLHHGFFEALQGNRPTQGIGIHSIGPEHVRWLYGTDDAITLIPDFLWTGSAAMVVSLGIIGWSLSGLRGRHGASVFLALFVLLTLVGGGVGHIPFFVAAWAWATRIHGELSWWRSRLGIGARRLWSRAWLPSLVGASLLFVIALELSVFGYPPLADDPDRLLMTIWMMLIASLLAMNISFAGAIARDVGPA